MYLLFRSQKANEQKIHNELGKMKLAEKKKLAQQLAEEVALEESNKSLNHPYQDSDFDNPFNTTAPHYSKEAKLNIKFKIYLVTIVLTPRKNN